MADKKKLEKVKNPIVVDERDEWVISNMKPILDWTRIYNKGRYAPIKNAFQKFKNAKGMNARMNAFEELKASLTNKDGKSLIELMNAELGPIEERMQSIADEEYNGDTELVPLSPASKESFDFWNPIRASLTSMPKYQKPMDNLTINDAYSDKYDVEQMTRLAADYGYDYNDPEERKEFLKQLSDYTNARAVEAIWDEPSVGNMVTKIAYPVAREYAKKNYKDIDASSIGGMVSDMKGPLLADVASQATMAYGGSLPSGGWRFVGSNMAAPLITEAAQVGYNDKDIKDAALDAGAGFVLNLTGPKMVEAAGDKILMPIAKGVSQARTPKAQRAVQEFVDETVAKNAKILRDRSRGVPFREVNQNVVDLDSYYKLLTSPKVPDAEKKYFLKEFQLTHGDVPSLYTVDDSGKEVLKSLDAWKEEIFSNPKNIDIVKMEKPNGIKSVFGKKEPKVIENPSGDEIMFSQPVIKNPLDLPASNEMAYGNLYGDNPLTRIFGSTEKGNTLKNKTKAFFEKGKKNHGPLNARIAGIEPKVRLLDRPDVAAKFNDKLNDRLKVTGLQGVTPFDLRAAGYKESLPAAIARTASDFSEEVPAVWSLGANLLSSNRAVDQYGRAFDRLNGVYEYGKSNNEEEVDASEAKADPTLALYVQAYAKHIKNPEYYKAPPKPDGMSDKKLKALQDAIEKSVKF